MNKPVEASRGTFKYHHGVAFPQHLPVAKITQKDIVLGGVTIPIGVTEEVTEEFGPLKVVLGSIPAVYANSQVRI